MELTFCICDCGAILLLLLAFYFSLKFNDSSYVLVGDLSNRFDRCIADRFIVGCITKGVGL